MICDGFLEMKSRISFAPNPNPESLLIFIINTIFNSIIFCF